MSGLPTSTRCAAIGCELLQTSGYGSNEELLADAQIDIVVNLTSIESHYDVTSAALRAGKHVYSEKPLVTDLAQARALFELAEMKGL